MSVITNFDSRAVRLGMVMTVVRQCNSIEERATAYRVAKALDCSHVTARKYLNDLVKTGELVKIREELKHTVRYTYELGNHHMDNEQFVSYANYLIRYWTKKGVS